MATKLWVEQGPVPADWVSAIVTSTGIAQMRTVLLVWGGNVGLGVLMPMSPCPDTMVVTATGCRTAIHLLIWLQQADALTANSTG